MFQSLQATFVIITDLSQKVKGFLAFCSTFFKSFFLPDIQLAGFSSYVFPPRFVSWASQRISTFASLFLLCCILCSFPASLEANKLLPFLFFFRATPHNSALRLKHRSGSCGTASALPKCSIRHPVLSALLAWHLPHLAHRIGT